MRLLAFLLVLILFLDQIAGQATQAKAKKNSKRRVKGKPRSLLSILKPTRNEGHLYIPFDYYYGILIYHKYNWVIIVD